MNEATLKGSDDCLCPVAYVEPHQNCTHMAFHCGFGDAEQARDLFIAHTRDQMAQNFLFSRTQLRIRQSRCQSPGHWRGQESSSRVYTQERFDQGLVGHSFNDVSLRAGFERAMNVLVTFIGGEDHKPGLWET